MAEYIPVSLIKDNLTECPICTEQFDDDVRIPLRMPCCVQSICQPCLQTYSQGQTKVACPMCRTQHLLPKGVASLPREPLILRILEQLKIQEGIGIPCTDCPDKNNAVAKCEECCISLCDECLRAHRRITSLKHHTVKTFEELKSFPAENVKRLHRCAEHHQPLQFYCTTCDEVICVSCTVLQHEKGDNHQVMSIAEAHKEKTKMMESVLQDLDKKETNVNQKVKELELQLEETNVLCEAAKSDVMTTFDSLIEVLQREKSSLLSTLGHKKDSQVKQIQAVIEEARVLLAQLKSSTEYTRRMREKADLVEDIQLIAASMSSLRALQEKQVEMVQGVDSKVYGSTDTQSDAAKELNAVVTAYFEEQRATERIAQQQRDEIQQLLKSPLKEGDFWYLVDINWNTKWEQYVGLDSTGTTREAPGPINNGPLFKGNMCLRGNVKDRIDYVAYPEQAWRKLVRWYGLESGQKPIQRPVLAGRGSSGGCYIGVDVLELRLCYNNVLSDIRVRTFNHTDTIEHLTRVMRKTFGIAEGKKVRLWTDFRELNRSHGTLQKAGLNHRQIISLEEVEETWGESWDDYGNRNLKGKRRDRRSKRWQND